MCAVNEARFVERDGFRVNQNGWVYLYMVRKTCDMYQYVCRIREKMKIE